MKDDVALDPSTDATRERFGPADFLLAAQILGLLLPVLTLQDRLPLPRLVKFFEAEGDGPPRPDRLVRARRLTDGLLHRLFGGAFCMKRSLILFHFMTKWSVDGQIRFGVARDGQDLKGHAWLEVDGQPWGEDKDVSGFKVVYSYPDASA
jgi:hypothetical protein